MAKKKDTTIQDWSKAISESWDKQRELDKKLSPSRGELRYLVDYAREIHKRATYIEYTSLLAHEGQMDFEMAQKIINLQKDEILRSIKYLKAYLDAEENE